MLYFYLGLIIFGIIIGLTGKYFLIKFKKTVWEWLGKEAFSGNTTVYWFYRPGCPHCDNMKGEWSKMKKSLPSKYNVIDVNTSLPENQKLSQQYNVQGVPHIVKVSASGQSVYNGKRTASEMKQWVMV
jgi:thiol-disulfide isomerase/thioredoxin